MQSSAEVKRAYEEFVGAIARGDASALEDVIASEVLVIGTDPAEWWTGHENAVRAFTAQMEEMGGGFPIRTRNPQGYQEGNAGWASDQVTLALPEGETSLRLTTVFVKENNRWRVVQSHASFGVTNQEAVGKELTI